MSAEGPSVDQRARLKEIGAGKDFRRAASLDVQCQIREMVAGGGWP